MKYLGLDVGDKTIGVAVTDEIGLMAHGVETLQRSSPEKDFEAIRRLKDRYQATQFVVGLPLNMDGSEGPQAAKVRGFMEELKSRTGLEVTPWDERLTTMAAERVLIEADLSRAKRRRVINKMAAALILQGYLDSLKNR